MFGQHRTKAKLSSPQWKDRGCCTREEEEEEERGGKGEGKVDTVVVWSEWGGLVFDDHRRREMEAFRIYGVRLACHEVRGRKDRDDVLSSTERGFYFGTSSLLLASQEMPSFSPSPPHALGLNSIEDGDGKPISHMDAIYFALWQCGYHILSASNYGGTYLLYCEPPSKQIHAEAIVWTRRQDQAQWSALDVTLMGRMAHAVKKAAVLAHETELGEVQFQTILKQQKQPHHPMIYVLQAGLCIRAAGMNRLIEKTPT